MQIKWRNKLLVLQQHPSMQLWGPQRGTDC